MGKAALAVIIGLILIVALSAGTWAWRYYTAEIRGVITAEEQIESAPSRIARYEEFFDLCASVQRNKAALNAQRERLEGEESQKERSRIRSNIAGLSAQIAGTVSRYNNNAAQDYTSGRFKASNLPYQLSTEGATTCAVQ